MQDSVAVRRMGHGSGRPGLAVAAWASLVPLMLLMHPYSGVVQDARIYIGRGVADRDPAGVGRDVLFLHDGQTGFSLMRKVVDASLSVVGPGTSAMALTFLGALVWLLAAAAVARALASGRNAWATAVCMVALPTFYGAYGIFNYAEAIATPRPFAQAAVLGGLAALMTGRRVAGAALLVVSVAIHPLIALPGVAVGAALLVRHDRRWLVAILAGTLAVLGGAVLGAPLVGRLLQPMDDVWLSILRQRSPYLFPTLWPAWTFGPIVCQATAVIVAATMSKPPVRALLLATLGVAASGVAASWLFGDAHASTLIVQLQPWRALWLLAVFGNAALMLAVLALWRRGADACLVLAPLALAWLWSDDPIVAGLLSALTLLWFAAMLRGAVPTASRLVLFAFAGTVCAAAVLDVLKAASAMSVLFRSAHAEGGAVVWPMVVDCRIQTVPVVAGAMALALMPSFRPSTPVRRALLAALAGACVLAIWSWDGRTTDRSEAEREGSSPALRAAIGPRRGEVLWIGEDSESWFLLGRPSFLNSAQAGPILFSRDLAIEWAARVHLLLQLGMARPENAAPWGEAKSTAADLVFGPDSVRRFCADERHPAALVTPGDRRAIAPPDARVTLWRPTTPIARLVIGERELHWHTMDLFTVIGCGDGKA